MEFPRLRVCRISMAIPRFCVAGFLDGAEIICASQTLESCDRDDQQQLVKFNQDWRFYLIAKKSGTTLLLAIQSIISFQDENHNIQMALTRSVGKWASAACCWPIYWKVVSYQMKQILHCRSCTLIRILHLNGILLSLNPFKISFDGRWR